MAPRKARNPFGASSPSPPPTPSPPSAAAPAPSPQEKQQSNNANIFRFMKPLAGLNLKSLFSRSAPKEPRLGTEQNPFTLSPSPSPSPAPHPLPDPAEHKAVGSEPHDQEIRRVESPILQRSRSTTVETDLAPFGVDEDKTVPASNPTLPEDKTPTGNDPTDIFLPVAEERARPCSAKTDLTIFGGPVSNEKHVANHEAEKLPDQVIPALDELKEPTLDTDIAGIIIPIGQNDNPDQSRKKSRSVETDVSLFGGLLETQPNTADDEAIEAVESIPQDPEAQDVDSPDFHRSRSVTLEPDQDITDIFLPVAQDDKSASVNRSRSRSVETDLSLFGGPAGSDEHISDHETELPPGDEYPGMEEEALVNAMSICSSSSTQTFAQIGLEWTTAEFDPFRPYPEWSCEPEANEVVDLLKQVISPLEEYRVRPLHKSSYNRFFAVQWGDDNDDKDEDENYVIKLTLPVCPARKTASEVATMRWTKVMTPLPLPDVVQNLYSASANNPVGCEWILMRKLPGRPLFECWHEMDWTRKLRVVDQLTEYTHCVFDRGLEGIANLYPAAPNDPDQRPEFGGMASMPFFWNGRYNKWGNQKQFGPYETYREWAFDRLDLAYVEVQAVLPKLTNQHLRSIPWRIQAVIAKLKELHDVLFPSPRNRPEKKEEPIKGATKNDPIDLISDDEDECDVEAEPFDCEEKTMLWHTNLSLDNIFVDETGVITGVLDWECISAIPRSLACQLPAFLLEGHDRLQEPHVKDYWTFSDTVSSRPLSPSPSVSPENETDEWEAEEERRGRQRKRRLQQVGPTPEYWKARREWELTELRTHFVHTMSERCLAWYMFYKHNSLKRDFETAVQYCDDPMLLGMVEEWIKAIEAAVEKEEGERKPGKDLGVWSLERRVAKGQKAPAGHNEL
ncbi:kinase-like domain-containing protein [Apiospora arundinis]|uniref:Kinase-like domain-containing protein n=1 Tax=Apiospora arundinis TaxID=335852 RepID=A0ABR2ITC4_9PEZI